MLIYDTCKTGVDQVASIQESKRAHRHHEKKEHATKVTSIYFAFILLFVDFEFGDDDTTIIN